MTPVHFMGREIGYWATDRFGFCRYRSLRLYWRDLAKNMPDPFFGLVDPMVGTLRGRYE